MSTLERKTVKPLNFPPERVMLLERASTMFGYSGNVSDRVSAESLKAAMLKLDIAPFDPATVRQYKESKTIKKRLNTGGDNVCVGVGTTAVVWFLCSTLFASHFFNLSHDTWPWVRIISMIASVVAAAIATGIYNDTPKSYLVRSWSHDSLLGYGLIRIPDFVLDRAITLKEACPSVEFTVEYLKEEREIHKRVVDPFLVATMGAEKFYIDVWDELDFERKL